MANRLLYLARHGESAPAPADNPEDGDLTEIQLKAQVPQLGLPRAERGGDVP